MLKGGVGFQSVRNVLGRMRCHEENLVQARRPDKMRDASDKLEEGKSDRVVLPNLDHRELLVHGQSSPLTYQQSPHKLSTQHPSYVFLDLGNSPPPLTVVVVLHTAFIERCLGAQGPHIITLEIFVEKGELHKSCTT